MNTAIAPSTMPASTAPSPSTLQAVVDDAGAARARRRRPRSADVPAAASALSISPVAQAATFGTMASTIAA